MNAWVEQILNSGDVDRPQATVPPACALEPQPSHGEAPNAVFTLDLSLQVTFWDSGAERLYGIDADFASGRRFSDLVSCYPSPPQCAKESVRALEAIGLVNGRAMHVVRANRHSIPVSVSLVPGGGTRPTECLVVVRDETPHLLLTKSLQERLDFEMLLSEMSARFSGLLEEQVDGEIHLWLRRLTEMLGVDRGSFSELTPGGGLAVTHSYAVPGVERYPPGPVSKALPWVTQELAAGRTVVLTRLPDDFPEHAVEERRFVRETGMKAALGIPVSIAGSLVCVLTFGAVRRPCTWSAEVISRLHLAGEVFANAIARRQSKQRLVQKQQELTHVGRVADMGRLASVIAHELDQPLAAVVTNAQAVRNMLQTAEPDLAEADDALSDVIDSAMRVSEIVKRERRLLRKTEGTFEQIDLNDALREIEFYIRADARQCGATVTLELLPGLPPVLGDKVQLQQVALNLTRNALQAVRQQPGTSREVSIRTASGIGESVFTVTDTGPQVEESVLERVFDPFFSTKPNGMGIGLSISKSIVEGHRGRIWPTRNPGGGLTMHVSIPRE